jgi:hypothetical protein
VLVAGSIVAALAAAFYYHFGAWGALRFAGGTLDGVEAHRTTLRTPTEYVTCLVRFARVFFGFGQVVLALGLPHGGPLPPWLAGGAAALGAAAMVLTMGLPDHLHFYRPIFHLNAAWMLAAGVAFLTTVGSRLWTRRGPARSSAGPRARP